MFNWFSITIFYLQKPDDQKLIYSGQLLKDKLILKDILRHYDGIQSQIHTFHLVCAPKFKFSMSSSFGSFSSHQRPVNQQQGNSTVMYDGLRQRNNIQGSSSSTATSATNNTNQNSSATTSSSVTPNMNNNFPVSSSSSFGAINNNVFSSFNPFGFQPQQLQQFPLPNEYMLAQQAAIQSWMHQAYVQYMNQYMRL